MLYKVATALLDEIPFGGLITSLLDCIKEGKDKGNAVDEKLCALDEGLSKWVESFGVANSVRTTVEKFRDDVRKKHQDRKKLGEEASSDRSDNDRNVVNDAIHRFEQGFEQNQRSLLGNLVERIEDAKSSASTIGDLLSELDNVLTEWLDAVSEHNAMNPVDELQSTGEDLRRFVHDMKNHREERVTNAFRNNQDNEKLDSKISASMQKIQFTAYRLIASTFLLASQTHIEVVRIGKAVDEMHGNVNETKRAVNETNNTVNETNNTVNVMNDTVNETNDTLNKMKDTLKDLVQKFGLQGIDRSLLSDPLDMGVIVKVLELLSEGDNDAAMELVLHMEPEKALKVVKEFLRLRTDNDVKRMGLIILDSLLEQQDANLCCRVIDVALVPVLELIRDVNKCDEEVKERASEVLEKMAKVCNVPFFERLRELSRDEKSQQAIKENHAIRLIVNCAINVKDANDGCAKNAFDVLFTLAQSKNDYFKAVIAQENGISILVELYRVIAESLEQDEDGEFERLLETSVQTVEVLARLSSNKECRPHFATGWEIWPFIHCFSMIDEENQPYYWDGSDGVQSQPKSPKDYARYLRCVTSVGRALWQLSLNDEHKAVLVSLSKLFHKSIRDIYSTLDEEDATNRFVDFLKWTEIADMSNQRWEIWRDRAAETTPNYDGNVVTPQMELYEEISCWLQRLSWSAAFDDNIALVVAKNWYKIVIQDSSEWGLAVAERWYKPANLPIYMGPAGVKSYAKNGSDELKNLQDVFYYTGNLKYWMKTVLHHVGVSEEMNSGVDFPDFLAFLVAKLESKTSTSRQKARIAKVLWFCSLITDACAFSKIEDSLATRCEVIVNTATVDEMEQIFWATGILTNLTWYRPTPKDFAKAAVEGVRRIKENGSVMFGFLEQYIA